MVNPVNTFAGTNQKGNTNMQTEIKTEYTTARKMANYIKGATGVLLNGLLSIMIGGLSVFFAAYLTAQFIKLVRIFL